MPIFQKKFALKIAPPRTHRLNIGCPPQQEDLDDFRSITLNLVDKQLCFIDGVWMNGLKPTAGGSAAASSSGATAHSMDDLLRMKRRVKTLEQENNMLQVKLDVLVDLLTENVIELNEAKNQ
ncbi:protein chibby homolog 1 [Anopheles ziemanni]|uniref:protein chibby homolog 1 n=1 Tax=Anopheles coustani TaxID=139045 RepID=UPI00265B0DA0|nr:protein chibby homolog 1 [Anopheles coustani]XP_058173692.1 protein chibby homolog 1 [Anopheles ziemanni]